MSKKPEMIAGLPFNEYYRQYFAKHRGHKTNRRKGVITKQKIVLFLDIGVYEYLNSHYENRSSLVNKLLKDYFKI